nr:unnamed protein product [Spirometra erinaceieuropaei]
MQTQHSSPGSMVFADAIAEFDKDSQLPRLLHGRQESMQVLVEFAPCCVRAVYRESVDDDDGGEFASLERQAEADQRSLVPCGRQGSCPTMSFRTAKTTPTSRRSALGRPLQKKV